MPIAVALVVKNPPVNAGGISDMSSIPGLGRSPGRGHGNPPQYSCLGESMDRGAWRATANAVAESDTTEQLTLSLSFSHILGTVLGAKDTVVNKVDKNPCLWGTFILPGRNRQ